MTLAVDIVVVNHNYARFLHDAISSAIAQRHPRLRVIVVDDGSTDESRLVANAFADRVDLIFKDNGGQASAVNVGLAAVEGDVVCFLDADDMLCPTFAGDAAEALGSRPQAVRAVFRAGVVDEAGRPSGRLEPPGHLPLSAGDLRAATLAHPFDLVWPPMSANAFRTSAVAAIAPVPEQDFRILADYYLVHATSLVGEVVALERVGAMYRQHGQNVYLRQASELDLRHLRSTMVHAERSVAHIARIAGQLGLAGASRPSASVSDLAGRLISLRLAPASHPVASDRAGRLWLSGLRAASRRDDVGWPMRAALALWITVLAVSPRVVLAPLATLSFAPERRASLNRLLRALRRR